MRLGALLFWAGYAMNAIDAHWLVVVLVTLLLLALGRGVADTNTMQLPERWQPIPETIVQTLGPRRVQDGYDG